MSSKVKWFLVILASMLLMANVAVADNNAGDGTRATVTLNDAWASSNGNPPADIFPGGAGNLIVGPAGETGSGDVTDRNIITFYVATDIPVSPVGLFPNQTAGILVDVYDNSAGVSNTTTVPGANYNGPGGPGDFSPWPPGANPIIGGINPGSYVYEFTLDVTSELNVDFGDLDQAAHKAPELGGTDNTALDIQIQLIETNTTVDPVTTSTYDIDDVVYYDSVEPRVVAGSEVVTPGGGSVFAGGTWTINGCSQSLDIDVQFFDPAPGDPAPAPLNDPAGLVGLSATYGAALYNVTDPYPGGVATALAVVDNGATGTGAAAPVTYTITIQDTDVTDGETYEVIFWVEDNFGNRTMFDAEGGYASDNTDGGAQDQLDLDGAGNNTFTVASSIASVQNADWSFPLANYAAGTAGDGSGTYPDGAVGNATGAYAHLTGAPTVTGALGAGAITTNNATDTNEFYFFFEFFSTAPGPIYTDGGLEQDAIGTPVAIGTNYSNRFTIGGNPLPAGSSIVLVNAGPAYGAGTLANGQYLFRYISGGNETTDFSTLNLAYPGAASFYYSGGTCQLASLAGISGAAIDFDFTAGDITAYNKDTGGWEYGYATGPLGPAACTPANGTNPSVAATSGTSWELGWLLGNGTNQGVIEGPLGGYTAAAAVSGAGFAATAPNAPGGTMSDGGFVSGTASNIVYSMLATAPETGGWPAASAVSDNITVTAVDLFGNTFTQAIVEPISLDFAAPTIYDVWVRRTVATNPAELADDVDNPIMLSPGDQVFMGIETNMAINQGGTPRVGNPDLGGYFGAGAGFESFVEMDNLFDVNCNSLVVPETYLYWTYDSQTDVDSDGDPEYWWTYTVAGPGTEEPGYYGIVAQMLSGGCLNQVTFDAAYANYEAGITAPCVAGTDQDYNGNVVDVLTTAIDETAAIQRHIQIVFPPDIASWELIDPNESNCQPLYTDATDDAYDHAAIADAGGTPDEILGRVTLDEDSGPANEYAIIISGASTGGPWTAIQAGGVLGTVTPVFDGTALEWIPIPGFGPLMTPLQANQSAVVHFDLNELVDALPVSSAASDAPDGLIQNIRIAVRYQPIGATMDIYTPAGFEDHEGLSAPTIEIDGPSRDIILDETDPLTTVQKPPFVVTDASGDFWTNNNTSWTLPFTSTDPGTTPSGVILSELYVGTPTAPGPPFVSFMTETPPVLNFAYNDFTPGNGLYSFEAASLDCAGNREEVLNVAELAIHLDTVVPDAAALTTIFEANENGTATLISNYTGTIGEIAVPYFDVEVQFGEELETVAVSPLETANGGYVYLYARQSDFGVNPSGPWALYDTIDLSTLAAAGGTATVLFDVDVTSIPGGNRDMDEQVFAGNGRYEFSVIYQDLAGNLSVRVANLFVDVNVNGPVSAITAVSGADQVCAGGNLFIEGVAVNNGAEISNVHLYASDNNGIWYDLTNVLQANITGTAYTTATLDPGAGFETVNFSFVLTPADLDGYIGTHLAGGAAPVQLFFETIAVGSGGAVENDGDTDGIPDVWTADYDFVYSGATPFGTLSIDAPATGININEDDIVIDFTVEGELLNDPAFLTNVPIDRVELVVDGAVVATNYYDGVVTFVDDAFNYDFPGTDATYAFNIIAYSTCGASQTLAATVDVCVDRVAPQPTLTITGMDPATNWFNGEVGFGSATLVPADNDPAASCGMTDTGTMHVIWPDGTVVDGIASPYDLCATGVQGTFTFWVEYTDDAGNYGRSVDYDVQADCVDPTIGFFELSDGNPSDCQAAVSNFTNSLTMYANVVTSPDVETVTFVYEDATNSGALDYPSEFYSNQGVYQITAVDNDANLTVTVTVTATDEAGNVSVVDTDDITLDTTVPVYNASLNAAYTSPTNSGTVTLDLAITETNPYEMEIWYTHNGSALAQYTRVPSATTTGFTFPDGDGTYTIVSRGFDQAGNCEGGSAAEATIIYDSTAPVASLNTIADCAAAPINIVADYADNLSNVTNFEVFASVDGGAYTSVLTYVPAAPDQANTGVTLGTFTPPSSGTWTLYVVATDFPGNVQAAGYLPVTFFYDATQPVAGAISFAEVSPHDALSFSAFATVSDDYELVNIIWTINYDLDQDGVYDNGTDTIEQLLDVAAMTVRLDYTAQACGGYQVTYQIADLCGNNPAAAAAAAVIDLDDEAPYANVTALGQASPTNSATTTVTIVDLDNTCVSAGYTPAATLYYRVNSGGWTDAGAAFTAGVFTFPATDGLYEFQAVAGTDDAGNADALVPGNVEASIFVDRQIPTAEIVEAGIQNCYNAAEIQTNGEILIPIIVNDDAPSSGINMVRIVLDGVTDYDFDVAMLSSGFVSIPVPANGAHTLEALAYDYAGNSEAAAAAEAGFTVDTVLPIVTPNAGLVDQTPDPILSIPYTLGETPVMVDMYYQWSEDGTNFGDFVFYGSNDDGAVGSDIVFDISSAAGNGYYRFYFVATDVCGNEGVLNTAPASEVVLFDTVMPLSYIDTDNLVECYQSGNIAVTGLAWNGINQISAVDILVYRLSDNTLMSTTAASLGSVNDGYWPFTATVPVPGTDGEYGLFSRATDLAGNVEIVDSANMTSDWVFYRDGTAPAFTGTFAVPPYSSDQFVTIPYNVTDGTSGVVTVALQISEQELPLCGNWTTIVANDMAATAATQGEFLFNAEEYWGDANYFFRIMMTDDCGNTSYSGSDNTIVDTNTPETTVRYNGAADVVCGTSTTIPVQFFVADNTVDNTVCTTTGFFTSGIASVEIFARSDDYTNGWIEVGNAISPANDGWIDASVTVIGSGTWEFKAVAVDNAGNSEELDGPGDFTFTVDDQIPWALLAELPVYTTNEDGIITLNYNVEDMRNADYDIPGEVTELFVYYDDGSGANGYIWLEYPDANGSIVIDVDSDLSLGDGLVSFYIEAFDCAGNSYESNIVTTMVDREAPTATLANTVAYDCITDDIANFELTLDYDDAISGVAAVELWVDYTEDGLNFSGWYLFETLSGAALTGTPMTIDPAAYMTDWPFDGMFEFLAVAIDNAGNREVIGDTWDSEFSMEEDGTPPQITVTPLQDYYTAPFNMNYYAYDEAYSSGLTVTVEETNLGVMNVTEDPIDGVVSYNGDDGVLSFTFTAEDDCQNTPAVVTVTTILDSQTPMPVVNALPEFCDNVEIDVTVNDNGDSFTSGGTVEFYYQYNEGEFVLFHSDAWITADGVSNTFTYTFDPQPVDQGGDGQGDGVYAFAFRAYDLAGNDSGIVTAANYDLFTYDNTAPNATLHPLPEFQSYPVVGITYDYYDADYSSGFQTIQLWYTHEDDADVWTLYQEHNPPEGSFIFNAPENGRYCFEVVAIDNCDNTDNADFATAVGGTFTQVSGYEGEDCVTILNDKPYSEIDMVYEDFAGGQAYGVTLGEIDVINEYGIITTEAAGSNTAAVGTVELGFTARIMAPNQDQVHYVELWYRVFQTCNATDDFTMYAQVDGESTPALSYDDIAGEWTGQVEFNFPEGDGMYQFYTIAVDSLGNRELPPAGDFYDFTLILDTNVDLPLASVVIADDFDRDRDITYTVEFSDMTDNCVGSGIDQIEVYVQWDCDFDGNVDGGPVLVDTFVPGTVAQVNAGTADFIGSINGIDNTFDMLVNLAGSFTRTYTTTVDGSYWFYAVALDRADHQEIDDFGDETPDATELIVVDTIVPESDVSDDLADPVEVDSLDLYYNEPILSIPYHAYNHYLDCTSSDNPDLSVNHPLGEYPRIDQIDLYFRVDRCNDVLPNFTPWLLWTEFGGSDFASETDGIDGFIEFDATLVANHLGFDGVYQFFTIATDHAGNREAWPNNAAILQNVDPINDDAEQDPRIAEIWIDTTPPVAEALCADASDYYTTALVNLQYEFWDPTPQGQNCNGSGVEMVNLWYRPDYDNDGVYDSGWVLYGTDVNPDGEWVFDSNTTGGDGRYRLEYVAQDYAGNLETRWGNDHPESPFVDTVGECEIIIGTDDPYAVFTGPNLNGHYNQDSEYPIVLSYSAEGSTLIRLANVRLYYRVDYGTWELADMHTYLDDPMNWEQGNMGYTNFQVEGTFYFMPEDGVDGVYEFTVMAMNLAGMEELPGIPPVGDEAALVHAEDANPVQMTIVDRVDPVVTSVTVPAYTDCNQILVNFETEDPTNTNGGTVSGVNHIRLFFKFTPEDDNENGTAISTWTPYPGFNADGMIYAGNLEPNTDMYNGSFIFDAQVALGVAPEEAILADGNFQFQMFVYDQAYHDDQEIGGEEANGYRNMSEVGFDSTVTYFNNVPNHPNALFAVAWDDVIELDWADNTEGDLAGYWVNVRLNPKGDEVLVFNVVNSQVEFYDGVTYNDVAGGSYTFDENVAYFFTVQAYDDNYLVDGGTCGNDSDGWVAVAPVLDDRHLSPENLDEVYAEMYTQQPLWVGWNMVSAPLEPTVDPAGFLASDVFDEVGAPVNVQWWDPMQLEGWPGNYQFDGPFVEGRGYYLYSFGEGLELNWIDVTGWDYSMDTEQEFPLCHEMNPEHEDAVEGWNMVGNNLPVPIYYQHPYAFGTLNSVTGRSLAENRYYQWDGSQYDYYPGGSGELNGTIDPGDAAWWHAADNTAGLTIYRTNLSGVNTRSFDTNVSVSAANEVAAKAGQSRIDELSWRLQLAANSANFHDNYNYLGVHNQARNSYDADFDAYELMPKGSDMMMVYFPAEEANLTADIRNSVAEDGETWTVHVETYNVNEPVTISWPNVADLPLHYGVLLINTETGETIDMRSAESYTFTPATATPQTQGELGAELEIQNTAVLLKDRDQTGVISAFDVYVYEIAVSAELATFEAVSTPNNIALNWTTSDESNDHLGFNVYRATGNGVDEAFVQTNTELVIGANMAYSFTDANVEDGATYTYKLATIDTWGNETEAGRLTVTYVPKRVFALDQNYPNPFNPTTTITFSLPVAGDATLKVFNSAGQLVRTLIDGTVEAGAHNIVWNGRNDRGTEVASGVYFYTLKQNDNVATTKMLLVK